MLILMKNNEPHSQVADGAALHLDGLFVSPAYAGWSHGEYNLVEAPPPTPEPVEQPPTVEQLQAAIEAVAKAAGLTDQALSTAMESAGLSRRAETQPVEPGPVIGGRE